METTGGRDIIVVGASAGGVEVLSEIVAGLPAGLPAALLVVCHFPPNGSSALPQILSCRGPLPAAHARHGEEVRPGRIYVAPPNLHLWLQPDRVELRAGARENNHRPAIDALFRSAARSYGPRVAAVILTGTLYDGVAGLMAVRRAGGVAVVQSPEDALFAAMPLAAQRLAGADYLLPAARMAAVLEALTREPIPPRGGPDVADPLEQMPERVRTDMQAQIQGRKQGHLSTFTCPECGGSLWQVDETGMLRFRCHVGHSYYGEGLLDEQAEALEAALWTAVRTYKEKAVLSRQLAAQERGRGNGGTAERFEEQADLAERYGRLIEQLIGNAAAGNDASAPAPPAKAD